MGMLIVKGFVEKMDGSIDVTSIQGEGSSFYVVLPFEIDRAPERHAGSADAEGECDVSGMRVLLAEDNDLNLEIATTLLADEGVAVTCAANGREAFDTFVDRPAGSFDAILMDIMMPVMDGYEAARHPQVRKGRCGVGADFRHDGERLCRGCPASPQCRHERASY